MAKQNAAARRKAARRVKKNVERGQAHIQSSFNKLPRLHRFMDLKQSMFL